MRFKLDNAEGTLIDLTEYGPIGHVMIPNNSPYRSGGATFLFTFRGDSALHKHLADLDSLTTTEQSQTYEYESGNELITGECFIKYFRYEGSRVVVLFQQTGDQQVRSRK